GDGKLDLVVTDYGPFGSGNTVSVLRNTSTIGNVSFGGEKTFTVGSAPTETAVSDLDGDGKPELVVTNYGEGSGTTVSVLRNTSTVGNVSLAAQQTFTVGIGPLGVAIGDLDGDGKSDVVVTNNGSLSGDGTTVSVLRNTSTVGNVSLAAKIDFGVGTA